MYAIIKTGGKQYRVKVGDTIDIERLEGAAGDAITFEEVLLINDEKKITIGNPRILDAQVSGQIVAQKKEKKVIVFKMKRRQNYKKKQGHRQQLTQVNISAISGSKEVKSVT